MRASRAELLRRIARFGLVAAAVSVAAPVAAQIGPPIPLVPAAPPDGSAAPAPAQPGGDVPLGIEAQPLAATDAAWTGVLGQDKGAFPESMWRGTPRNFVAAALPLLHANSSPALQDLARRLLLSNAISPAGQDAPNQPSLAATRLERLLASGDVEGALAMMDQLPPDPSGDAMDQTRVELRFAAGDKAEACQAVEGGITRYQSNWWSRALIACQAFQGNGAESALGLSLLREQNAPPDPMFDALIEVLGGHPHEIHLASKQPVPTPLRMALMAAAKQPLAADTLAKAGPAALLAYARSDALTPEERLPAAERAALLGALAPDALGALYNEVPGKPEEQVAALTDGKLPDDPKARAILYQTARSAAPTDTRAAAIAAFLAEARKRGAFPLAARLMAPAITDLGPADASLPVATDAARALLLVGDTDAARGWIDATQNKPLLVLYRIATEPAAQDESAAGLLGDGIAALASRDSGAAPAQADLLVALLGAFDEPLGTLDWAPLMEPPHDAQLPSAALWLDQQQAMAAKRVGETVLTSILLVEPGETLSLEPMLLGRAVAGLRTVGLEAEARALALEAAIDAGI